ncbi:MAG: hypothetical protein QHH15_05525 [Candidatus Thermoplasmatota archaeon]|jgi:DNA-directed RNA polymerase subunit M/transcription elongation factor TFIIS|nr:hypothetical protein [Candidatus Thermoplasmatota archaeon]
MTEIKIPTLECERCGHKWIPQSPFLPKVCPKCNSRYWDKKRGWYKKMKDKKKMSQEDKDWIGEKTEMAYYAPEKKSSKKNKFFY